jgi:UDP-N-acetylglucosamine pyrophosphorylase
MLQTLFDRLLPQAASETTGKLQTLQDLLREYGFDRVQHDQIQADLRSARIGLAQNRIPASVQVEDVKPGDVLDACQPLDPDFIKVGEEALAAGQVAVVSLAGGAGSRWTRGAGVVKALNPFCKFAGQFRNFIDIHLAKSRRTSERFGVGVPHVITTSYLTHDAIESYLDGVRARVSIPLYSSHGKSIGLRLIPMVRDLRFHWDALTQQVLDVQKQKVREGEHAALIGWAQSSGEGSDYTDNIPSQCIHPTGHWYEIPNMLRNGVLLKLFEIRPQLRYLMVHNVDTLGVDLDPALLGIHIKQGKAMTTEVIARHADDRGGGLARVDGRVRLIEGLALSAEELEAELSYYNSSTTWIDIDQLLTTFSLQRSDLTDAAKVSKAIRSVAARMPTYITIKDVKKRWGKGQEDVFPVTQYEKLWGDITALDGLRCGFVSVPRFRGQQLKEPAQLDGWWRDGSAEYVNSLCDWRY